MTSADFRIRTIDKVMIDHRASAFALEAIQKETEESVLYDLKEYLKDRYVITDGFVYEVFKANVRVDCYHETKEISTSISLLIKKDGLTPTLSKRREKAIDYFGKYDRLPWPSQRVKIPVFLQYDYKLDLLDSLNGRFSLSGLNKR